MLRTSYPVELVFSISTHQSSIENKFEEEKNICFYLFRRRNRARTNKIKRNKKKN